MKSIIINFKYLKEIGLEPEDLLLLYKVYNNSNVNIPRTTLQELQSNKFIKIIDNDYNFVLRDKAIQVIERLIVDSDIVSSTGAVKKSKRAINEEIEGRLSEYRHLWKGLKLGSMGSAKSCKQKLQRWMQENPEYSFDDIVNAASIYIESVNDRRYLQRADYFIFKQNANKEESSGLSAFIEEELSDEDWTTNIN